MKICCLIDSLGSGGAQRQMTRLIGTLIERGHQLELLTYFSEFQHFLPAVRAYGVEPQNVSSTSYWGRFWGIRRRIRRMKPDCLISFLNTPNLLAVFSSIGWPRIPVIVSERSLDNQGKTRANRLRFNAFRLADRVVTNSVAQKRFIEENFPFLTRRTVVVRNSVDFNLFHPRDVDSSAESSSSSAKGLRIIVGASVIPVKNTHRLIEAVDVVRRSSGLDVVVDWYGNNLFQDGRPTEQSKFFLEAQALVERLGLQEHFRFFDAVTDFHLRLHDYDAVCLPSLFEGCPNLVCEAMASGKPVIASDISDIAEIVGSKDFLFDPLSVSSIADAIRRLGQLAPERRKQRGRELYLRAQQLFSQDAFGAAYDRLLHEVAERRSSRREVREDVDRQNSR